jgi:creatinine amidohydrolase/Fe(II)-dependent formamide hydrolase-like protein
VIGGDPRQASAQVGERVLSAVVDAYEKVLTAWRSEP